MGLARLFSSPALSFFLLCGSDESNNEAIQLAVEPLSFTVFPSPSNVAQTAVGDSQD